MQESLETELQSARAATDDLISKFEEAQSLSGIVAGEVERLTGQLAEARAENETLSRQTGALEVSNALLLLPPMGPICSCWRPAEAT